jgi:rhamnogalacturonyl hydrolase YesR
LLRGKTNQASAAITDNNYLRDSKMKTKSPSLRILSIVCLAASLFGTTPSFAQIDPGAGIYNTPYGVPSQDSIKSVIARINNYFTSQPAFQVIDQKTQTPINDRNKFNPNANLNKSGNDVISLWSYTMGVTYSGMLKASEAMHSVEYQQYPVDNLEFFADWLPYFHSIDSAFGEKRNAFSPVLHTGSLDDCGAMGAALIKIYKVKKDPRFLPIINHIAEFVSTKQFRLKDGTLARQRPQKESLWADDSYMSIPFLAQMGSLTGDKKYYDDAVKQMLQLSKYLFRPEKRLFDHGVNLHNAYDPNIYWGRANGWMLMSAMELLDVLPENYQGREEVLSILRSAVQGITECQSGDGLWHNLLDKTDSYEETSCSAMFVYTIAHGINKGWIDYTYGPVALAGWNALATRVNERGEVSGTCWGTTFASENVYYYHRPTSVNASHGYGPMLFAAAEMLELLQNDSLVIQKGFYTIHFRLKSDVK